MRVNSLLQDMSLPRGWKWVSLGEVCDAIRGVTFKASEATDRLIEGFVGCVTTSAVQTVPDWDSRRYIPATRVRNSNQFLRSGDILVSTANSKALVGKSCLVTELPEKCAFGAFVTVLRPRPSVSSSWMSFALKRDEAKDYFFERSSNTTNISNLRASDLLDHAIPLPPLAEQKRIVGVLNAQMAAVESARKATKERLEAAQALREAFLREMFSKFESKRCNLRPLGDVADIRSGIQKTPSRDPVKNFRPYLTVRNVQRGYISLDKVEYFEVSPSEVGTYKLMHGDLLLVEGNGSPTQIGRNALFKSDGQEWVHQNHIIRVRLHKEACSPSFISMYLNSDMGIAQMMRKAETTSGLYTLSKGKVASLDIPVPSIAEQMQVVKQLSHQLASADDLKKSAKGQLSEIEAMPSAALGAGFSGKV